VELNQRYSSAAVLADAGPAETWARDPELFYQPTTRPGAKLPHAWLVGERGERLSTLDLVGRGMFTVLTGVAGHRWTAAAEETGRALGISLRVARIGAAGARDAYGEWGRLSEIDEDGCLLVRPDGYLAWRCPARADGHSAALTQALSHVLQR
jgi:2,4-dichlorophenol 6-monooxygenase